MEKMIINAVGDQCPIPVVKTTKALNALTGAATLEVHVDNEIAVQNLTKLANSKSHKSFAEKKSENLYIVTIQVEGASAAETANTPICPTCAPDKRGNTVVTISSDRMGEGNDELGKVLIKGFIFALSQLEELPSTILFYNGGATITTEDSASLADLKNMEAQGVEILTCGTCLDYYGIKDKLAVGSVTNMYTIVEKMMNADKIIKQ